MVKNILLVAGQAKEEQDLFSILREINFGVFLENDPIRIQTLLHQQVFHMVILFERAILDHMKETQEWLSFVRQTKVPILWAVSPSFDSSQTLIKKSDLKLIWPIELDLVIDAIETSIGLPAPMEEHTLRISEEEVNEMISKRQLAQKEALEHEKKSRQNDLERMIAELEKQNQELQKNAQTLSEELRSVYNELQKEKEATLKLKQILASATELIKK